MKKQLHLIIFIFFLSTFYTNSFAQKWSDWENLYSNSQISVKIQFKIRNSCEGKKRKSKFRYKIEGTKYSSTKYVYWKLKYKKCNNEYVKQQNKIAIGGSTAVMGMIESGDYMFESKKVLSKFYDVKTNLSSSNSYTNNESTNQNTSNTTTTAKGKWTKWQKLYYDSHVSVDIKFKIRENSCANGGKNSKYKYRIRGTKYKYSKYVYWKMKYINCSGEKIVATNEIAIGGASAVTGIVESMDYIFLAKKVLKRAYGARTRKSRKEIKKMPKKKLDRKAYRFAKRTERKKLPFRWNFKLGAGIGIDMGVSKNITFVGIEKRFFDPYISAGLFRRFGRIRHYYYKHFKSRAEFLFGIFADAGLYHVGMRAFANNDYYVRENGFLHIETGVHFGDVFRISAGIFDNGINSDFSNYKYSATTGLSFRIRRSRLNFNFTLLTDQAIENFYAYMQIGLSFSFNFYRSLSSYQKRKLKRKYSY